MEGGEVGLLTEALVGRVLAVEVGGAESTAPEGFLRGGSLGESLKEREEREEKETPHEQQQPSQDIKFI